jgi:hypothetical protein
MPLPPASGPNTARAFEFQGEGFRFPVPGSLFFVLGALFLAKESNLSASLFLPKKASRSSA